METADQKDTERLDHPGRDAIAGGQTLRQVDEHQEQGSRHEQDIHDHDINNLQTIDYGMPKKDEGPQAPEANDKMQFNDL